MAWILLFVFLELQKQARQKALIRGVLAHRQSFARDYAVTVCDHIALYEQGILALGCYWELYFFSLLHP